ncbi:MAG: GAP family protein [Solirubrobacterales bacterium]|nr:GAP family protein [Solirubrobacterales bacterium]MBV9425846.1 GAP family protein [Solirubrobacterales bacterium]MBV9798175.1 GAP family protein [Solirubrobacterales bacterium]
MFRLIGLAVSIGLADSLNPSTIAPALYLATGQRAREQITEFSLAVFAVNLVCGAAVALGPGQLILSLVPHPERDVRYSLEIVAGLAMLVAGALLWRHRGRLADRSLPQVDPHGRSGRFLGATISLVEFPTAFPYFAVIAAVVASGLGPTRQLVLLLIYNICFVIPLIAIIATLVFAGDSAQRVLNTARNFLQRNWPTLLAVLAFAAGFFVVFLGATGLASHAHGGLGRAARRLHHIVTHPLGGK